MATSLKALALTCTLKSSPEASSSDLIARQVLDELRTQDVTGELVRVVDFDVPPGIATDLGQGDQWPTIRERVLDADILLLAVPTWLGHPSSIAQRVLERLNAEEHPSVYGKVGVVAVVGNEDGAHKIIADCFQALNDIGFTVPAGGGTYWNNEAMNPKDYLDLDSTPDAVAATTRTLAANAAHLARLLRGSGYPT
ncbi:flavodoxin [Actinophytocola xinjiangensis]|uniref:Flavodoxin n=1 Tax=Actinophytocola xinjiangensis TaxID=485602 RepID=A0A7Z0WLY6_9PSEU|nr:NAD(P)H-dependent oxidoreductase [Actinophytocola xinjiangensis]OLF09723.1 flavodoxin [Actinophytocola xinjiangensis]